MKTLKITTQFKKDLKRYKNRPKVIEKLEFILGLLQNELPIPEENKPHPLTCNYRGHMECHVEKDTLLGDYSRHQTDYLLHISHEDLR